MAVMTAVEDPGDTTGDHNLRVRSCRVCNRKSNQLNPLLEGPGASCKYVPWLYGEDGAPEGWICKISYHCFQLSGFQEEYRTLNALVEAASKNPRIQKEIKAVEDKYIELVNAGVITEKLRGRRREGVFDSLSEERKKVVTAFQEHAFTTRVPMRGMSLDIYRKKYGEPSPEVKIIKDHIFPDGSVKDAVLLKKLDDDEFEAEVECRQGVALTETLDNGSCVLRRGQQKAKFDYLATNLVSKADTLHMDRALPEEEPKLPGDNEGEADFSDHDSVADELPDIAGILSVLSSSATTSRKSARSATPAVKQEVRAGRARLQKSVTPVGSSSSAVAMSPRSVPEPLAASAGQACSSSASASAADPGSDSKCARRAGAAAAMGSMGKTPEDVLAEIGFSEKQLQAEALEAALASELFAKPTIAAVEEKEFQKQVKQVMGDASKLYKEVMQMQHKLGKRVHSPAEAVRKVADHRERAQLIGQLMGLMLTSMPEFAKVEAAVDGFKQHQLNLPVQILARIFKLHVLHEVRFDRCSNIAGLMSHSADKFEWDLDTHKQICFEVLDQGVAFILDGTSKKDASKAKDTVQYMCTFVSEVVKSGMLGKDVSQELELAAHVFSLKDTTAWSEQRAGLAKILSLQGDANYAGPLFGLVHHPSFKVMTALVEQHVADLEKADGIKPSLIAASQALNLVSLMFENSLGEEIPVRFSQKDFDEVTAKFDALVKANGKIVTSTKGCRQELVGFFKGMSSFVSTALRLLDNKSLEFCCSLAQGIADNMTDFVSQTNWPTIAAEVNLRIQAVQLHGKLAKTNGVALAAFKAFIGDDIWKLISSAGTVAVAAANRVKLIDHIYRAAVAHVSPLDSNDKLKALVASFQVVDDVLNEPIVPLLPDLVSAISHLQHNVVTMKDVAMQQYDLVVASFRPHFAAVLASILDGSGSVEALAEVRNLATPLRQLSTWSPTAKQDQAALMLAQDIANFAEQHAVLHRLNVNRDQLVDTLLEQHGVNGFDVASLVDIGQKVKADMKCKHQSLCFLCSDSSLAARVLEFMASTASDLKAALTCSFEALMGKGRAHMEEMDKMLFLSESPDEDFLARYTKPVAEQIAKQHESLNSIHSTVVRIAELVAMEGIGSGLDNIKQHLCKSRAVTAKWAALSLLRTSGITHASRGKQLRQQLKQVFDEYMCVPEVRPHLNDGLLSQVEEVLRGDAGAGQAASVAEQVAPAVAPKRRGAAQRAAPDAAEAKRAKLPLPRCGRSGATDKEPIGVLLN